MSLSLDRLDQLAAEAEAMPDSDVLMGQCARLAIWCRQTRWHHSVRQEAKRVAKRLDNIVFHGPRAATCNETDPVATK